MYILETLKVFIDTKGPMSLVATAHEELIWPDRLFPNIWSTCIFLSYQRTCQFTVLLWDSARSLNHRNASHETIREAEHHGEKHGVPLAGNVGSAAWHGAQQQERNEKNTASRHDHHTTTRPIVRHCCQHLQTKKKMYRLWNCATFIPSSSNPEPVVDQVYQWPHQALRF